MGARSDNFTRANNAGTIGSPSDGGAAWAEFAGNTWGISSNQGYCASGAANAVAGLQTTSITDMVVQATIATVGTNFGVVARAADDQNFLLFQWLSGTGYRFFKRVAGAFTSLHATVAGTPSNGDVFRIECSGNSITFKLNGSDILGGAVTESAGNTNTYGGLYASSDTAARFTTFSITQFGAASFSAGATLGAIVAGGSLGPTPGTYALGPILVSGIAQTNAAMDWVRVYSDAGILLYEQTGGSTDSNGYVAVSTGTAPPGTTVRLDWQLSSGKRRMPRVVMS